MNQHPNVTSYDRFINEQLPAEIARAFNLIEYDVTDSTEGHCAIRMTIQGPEGEVAAQYDDLPSPRPDGSFIVDGTERAVVMVTDSPDLERARISCAGEQILDEIQPRIVAPPEGVELSADLLHAWLPLDRWIKDFLLNSPTSQPMEYTNWLAGQAYLRRIVLPEDSAEMHPSQIGRVCPLETPEGPNCGRVLHLAVGAEVTEGRIVIRDHSPEAALGLTATMIPLLEHNDGPRQMGGVNMMRQWLDLGAPEPALVRSGAEPDDDTFWVGRNLLTAFIHWKGLNYEDGIVVSESCARKLASPEPLEVGDKLSNRHGSKGVVAAILPDDEMPHLLDGTPAELIFDSIGIHTRLNFGQVREAILGNVARARGEPVVAPPFEGPSEEELRGMLAQAGLPEDGQMQLTDGKDGPTLMQPSTVGYVYWGKTAHRARVKLGYWVPDAGEGAVGSTKGQRSGELERYALRTCGAYENVIENLCTRSVDRSGVDSLPEDLARGPVQQAEAPSPAFLRLRALLHGAGISAEFDGSSVRFGLAESAPDDIPLAIPSPHPWCPQRQLTHVGKLADCDQAELIRANERAARSLAGDQEHANGEGARDELADQVRQYLEALPLQQALIPGNQVAFSSRTVLAPGPDLELGQIGLPEEMCWGLFEPLVIREVGKKQATSRGPEALETLKRVMTENLVLMNRAPSIEPTSITAFQPVLRGGPVITLHPLCCRMFNADFDGDQAAIFLPITDAAQREARERLTVEAHLRRDPGTLIGHLTPSHAILFGLAVASRGPAHRERLLAGWPEPLAQPPDFITRQWLMEALRGLHKQHGEGAVMEALDQLMRLGIEAATASGASIHPFIGSHLDLPPVPEHQYPAAWLTYCQTVEAAIAGQANLESPDTGPQLIAITCGARGSLGKLRELIGPRGPQGGYYHAGWPLVTRSLRDGIPPQEHLESLVHSRKAMQRLAGTLTDAGYELRATMLPKSDGVLARAMRAGEPGEVFAAAAHDGEVDPLTDPVVRLFVGLRPLADSEA